MTVHEVSRLTGVSIRTLQYYDSIGLLHPAQHTEAGYRLYDDAALETLQQILLFRELEFPLKEIRQALEQQIELLQLRKEHLENLIDLACGIRLTGGKSTMNFSAFDTKKIDEYAAQARSAWGSTPEYREFEEKSKDRSKEQIAALNEQMMQIFAEFGAIKGEDPSSERAQQLVKALKDFITAHFYTCSNQVLSGLGQMYAGGGEMTANIDRYGGAGTAAFANAAIQAFCT